MCIRDRSTQSTGVPFHSSMDLDAESPRQSMGIPIPQPKEELSESRTQDEPALPACCATPVYTIVGDVHDNHPALLALIQILHYVQIPVIFWFPYACRERERQLSLDDLFFVDLAAAFELAAVCHAICTHEFDEWQLPSRLPMTQLTHLMAYVNLSFAFFCIGVWGWNPGTGFMCALPLITICVSRFLPATPKKLLAVAVSTSMAALFSIVATAALCAMLESWGWPWLLLLPMLGAPAFVPKINATKQQRWHLVEQALNVVTNGVKVALVYALTD
eukprot:TRINITY_DN5944_c0_g1_i1.p1 TRINITY_DN5944_c0_g1~~TRINITY_DN5944_c0_g1_i1.p1  ORF type:complete len:275 (-),score=65.76 TRINITY_DN5944_c0_g1_i1:335-1159(-)